MVLISLKIELRKAVYLAVEITAIRRPLLLILLLHLHPHHQLLVLQDRLGLDLHIMILIIIPVIHRRLRLELLVLVLIILILDLHIRFLLRVLPRMLALRRTLARVDRIRSQLEVQRLTYRDPVLITPIRIA